MINKLRDQTFTKEPWQYPHLEDIVAGKTYALTISPKIQARSFSESYLMHMDQIFKILSPNSSYKLRPEISTKSTILHFHGTIKFPKYVNIPAFYYHTIPLLKDYCTFYIKPIEDYEWYLYCIKARHIMKPYCDHIKLPYKLTHNYVNPRNHTNFFSSSDKGL